MRLVLIVQALIILAGAYYVYTLTREASAPSEEDAFSNVKVEVRRDTENKQNDNVDSNNDNSGTNSEVIIEGNNDFGMEFPTPDNASLEVR